MTPAANSTAPELRRRQLLALAAASALPLAAGAGLPELVAKAKPSVVLVGTYSELDSPRFQFRGTGFIVGDGLQVVTNAHVLPEPEAEPRADRRLMVQIWRGGQQWEGRGVELQSLARATDLALLRLAGGPMPALPLAGRDMLAEGSEVALIGFPIGGALGFSHVTHRGLVSSVTRITLPQGSARQLNPAAVRQLRDGAIDIYQLDAVAYPGNSGGPVLDVASGTVIGVVNMVLTKAGREGALSAPSGISYAIPVAQVHALMAR
jgi:S1-C subfamily serine protease